MFAVIRPGGTIKDKNVVLRPHETLPNAFNIPETLVYREDPETYKLTLIKPIGSVLPGDSDLLSDPVISMPTILDLTVLEEGSSYEHIDIIKIGEAGDSDDDSDTGRD